MFTPELDFLARYTRELRTRLVLSSEPTEGEEPPEELDAASVLQATFAAGDDTLPIIELAERFRLDEVELDILLFAAVPRLDPTLSVAIAMLCAPFPIDSPCPFAWLRMISARDPQRAWIEQYRFNSDQSLRRYGLIELLPKSDRPFEHQYSDLVVPGDVLGLLRGDQPLDERLVGVARRLDPEPIPAPAVPPSVIHELQKIINGHDESLKNVVIAESRATLAVVHGGRGGGKSSAIRALTQRLGINLLEIDGDLLDTRAPDHIEHTLSLAFRHVALHHELLLIDGADRVFSASRPNAAALRAAARKFPAMVFLTVRDPDALDTRLLDQIPCRVKVPLPDFANGVQIWDQALGMLGIHGVNPTEAAERYPLDGRQIANAARLLSLQEDRENIDETNLRNAALAQLGENLKGLGAVEESALGFEHLILTDEIKDQLKEIVSAFKNRRALYEDWGFGFRIHRGRGLICLFDGEPGTGKTMCAEVLANELGLVLARVNTSEVIDKYIGETEKKLSQLFERAHPGLNLLLFDEAEALFAKRTKVERSSDRYANSAITVLLQLVEHYQGLVVLTTNLKSGIDPAFERRFSFRIGFPAPEKVERAAIWRGFIPDAAPCDEELDFDLLAQEFELAGGSIKSAVTRAAYLALRNGTGLNMEVMLEAGYRELASTGKLVRQDWEE